MYICRAYKSVEYYTGS